MTPAGGGAAAAAPFVRLRGLRKRFGSREALAGIDLDLRGGGMVGVVGPDGAGKTTLLRTLAGLLEVEADEAVSLGHDLLGDVRDYKRQVGYVPQAFSLYRELSVADNLAFTARLHGLAEDAFRRRRDQLLERTGLAPFAERKAGALSGGMKQKLAVSNALLPSPRLLVLDEPTAGIDVVARREIYDVLEHLGAGVLIVVSTSYLEEAAECDHLVYLRAGRVVAQGSPSALEDSTGTEAWRAWSDDGPAVLAGARALPWVDSARDCGRFVRLEVRADDAPGDDAIARALLGLGPVALAERAPADLESTLLALARKAGAR